MSLLGPSCGETHLSPSFCTSHMHESVHAHTYILTTECPWHSPAHIRGTDIQEEEGP